MRFKSIPPWAWFVFSLGSILIGVGGFLPSDSYGQAVALQIGSVAMLLVPVVVAERGILSAFAERVEDSLAIQESIIEESASQAVDGSPEPVEETEPAPEKKPTGSRHPIKVIAAIEKRMLDDGWEQRKRGSHSVWEKDGQRIVVPLTPMDPVRVARNIERMLRMAKNS
ncbi:hypothetical protein ACWGE0_31690 [Lentzea sp. NPDC054927]